MTHVLESTRYMGERLPAGSRAAGIRILRCEFENCVVGTMRGGAPCEIVDAQIENSTGKSVYLYDTTFRRCRVSGYQSKGPPTLLEGCFFEDVVVEDVHGRILVQPRGFPNASGEAERAFYVGLDTFALDIRRSTGALEVSAIPPEVVWCDPSRQGFVRVKEALSHQQAKEGPFRNELLSSADFGEEHLFVSLPARGKKNEERRRHLRRLSELGLLGVTYDEGSLRRRQKSVKP